MAGFVRGSVARQKAAQFRRRMAEGDARVAAWDSQRYQTETQVEPGASREWIVTAPLSLRREDDNTFALVELAPDTSLRYEHVRHQSGYDGEHWADTTRRFLVLDGPHAGARVLHSEISVVRDDGSETPPTETFPPAGLVPRTRDEPGTLTG
jgi:hypothetical protein